MKQIKIVDFPFCNANAIHRYASTRNIAITPLTPNDNPKDDEILFIPGVGKFHQAIDYLQQQNLNPVIHEYLNKNISIGICLGMQILLLGSDESPDSKGLGFFEGFCRKIPSSPLFRIPHVGWNSLVPNLECPNIFSSDNIEYSHRDYYFVHSYYCNLNDPSLVSSSFRHPESNLLTASLEYENRVFGFQFHPEKSGKAGYNLLDHVVFQR